MDLRPLLGIVVALVALWAALLVLFWVLRPRGVTAREIARVVPDVLRLLGRWSGTTASRSTCGSCSWASSRGSCRRST